MSEALGVFWWLSYKFLSFCLGQDWNSSSFNTSASTAEELHGQYHDCGPSQPAPATFPALPGAKSNITDGFLLGLCWASLSSGKQQYQVPWGDLCSAHLDVYPSHTVTQKGALAPHLGLIPSPWHPCFPRTKLSQWHLTTPDQGEIQTSNFIIGCMSH